MSKHIDGYDGLAANPSPMPETIDWQAVLGGMPGPVPKTLNTWLFDDGSLTRKLIALSKDQFEVQVLQRDVVLKGRGRPWIFARSILPMTTMTGRLAGLRNLSNQPLGELLFQDPSMTREPLETAYLPARVLSVPAPLAAGDDRLWARRSVFFLDQKPLLVTEVFLSEFKP